ncbi:MAG: hypothetical protein EA353_14270 [Puniceicoccaceae bacterium]|nr:MAG: hypothetical protein EA353_14270 [Puniceicoccaceae bacterium]
MIPLIIDIDFENSKQQSGLLPLDPAAHYAPVVEKAIEFGELLYLSDSDRPVIASDDLEGRIARNQPIETCSKIELGYPSPELKWTKKLESEFDGLAVKYALDEISPEEEVRLSELIKAKRTLAQKERTAAEVVHEILRKRDERELVTQINGFLQRYATHG